MSVLIAVAFPTRKGVSETPEGEHTGVALIDVSTVTMVLSETTVVKHRRVHEKAGAKRPPKPSRQAGAKGSSASKQNPELSKAPVPALPFKIRCQITSPRFSLHASKDRTHSMHVVTRNQRLPEERGCASHTRGPVQSPLSQPAGEQRKVWRWRSCPSKSLCSRGCPCGSGASRTRGSPPTV